jgi:hypothetical protein
MDYGFDSIKLDVSAPQASDPPTCARTTPLPSSLQPPAHKTLRKPQQGCGRELDLTLYAQLFNNTGKSILMENCHWGGTIPNATCECHKL